MVQEGQAFERVVYVVDISEAEALPTSEYRKSIIDWMKNAPYDHMCMVQSGFGVIRVAMRFVVARANASITVHKDMDEALRKARAML